MTIENEAGPADGSSPRDSGQMPKKARPSRRPSGKGTGSRADASGGAAETHPETQTVGCVVVGVGASAGGLVALRNFLQAMPPDSGMAFVIVQHLKPDHESLAAELLSRHTRMKIAEVEGEPRILPDHVYVIPPNRNLSIQGDRLHLHPLLPEERGIRAPIDFFLRSLAQARKEKAVGIILSGCGSDGSLGLKEIKAHGGMTIAQDPSNAQHDSMPRSAIATGVVDHVLPIERMPDVLVKYARHPYVNGTGAETAPEVHEKPDCLLEILGVLRARTKYDFRRYKKHMLVRRIQRRMGLSHVQDMPAYLNLLRTVPNEASQLFKDLLISVTGFFREAEAFKVLEQSVIPQIVAAKDADVPVRVWVSGCATGEEPYSIAILLLEHLADQHKSNLVQIFASDIDEDALRIARAGVYPEAADVATGKLRPKRAPLTHATPPILSRTLAIAPRVSSVVRGPLPAEESTATDHGQPTRDN